MDRKVRGAVLIGIAVINFLWLRTQAGLALGVLFLCFGAYLFATTPKLDQR